MSSSESATRVKPFDPEIRGPEDVKALPEERLPELADAIREVLIHSLSRTGGHLGPNLGVVELCIAMHRVFETPKDRFVFDVSHQGYVHKMLTGRWNKIQTIRQYEGLNGFLLRTESEHDCYGAGHAGTAVSAALGMAVARDVKGTDEHVVAVAGDAAFTCGPTFEALNNIAASTKKFILVLNDNEWSIAKNVGAIAKYFNRLATTNTYAHLHEQAASFLEKVAGKGVRRLARKVEEGAKNLLLQNVIFEEFGIRYYGPIDGHDIPTLVHTLDFLKRQTEPVVLHIITEKGRGYEPALKNPGKFHGLGAYTVDTGETPSASLPTYSQLFAEYLAKFAKDDNAITAITAAMPGGTGLAHFQNEVPERYFDVGIAEEHAALFACGQATEDLKPFLAIYSTFMQRAYDMIIHDMAIQNLPVRLCMDRAGLSGDDGPTHHGLFDIGYLRHVPNFIHMQPKDEDELVDMLHSCINHAGPAFIRYPRGAGVGVTIKDEPAVIPFGQAEVLREGTQIQIWALGPMVDLALKLAEQIGNEEGISVGVVNARFAKPLDKTLLLKQTKFSPLIVTMEDHVITGGFGSAVIETLQESNTLISVEHIGWPDKFVEHGSSIDILREAYDLSPDAIRARILKRWSQTEKPVIAEA